MIVGVDCGREDVFEEDLLFCSKIHDTKNISILNRQAFTCKL